MESIEVDFESWIKEYNPSQNLINTKAPFGGILFGIIGEEFSQVVVSHPNKIWTYCIDYSGEKVIVQGFLPLKALGYIICDKKEIGHGGNVITVKGVKD